MPPQYKLTTMNGHAQNTLANQHARNPVFSTTMSEDPLPDVADEVTSRSNDSNESNIARSETLHVARSRQAVIVIMLITAVFVVVATYMYLNDEEVKDFEYAFQNYAKTIADATHYHARNMVDSLESRAHTITSYVRMAGDSAWPFVTLPDFELRYELARKETFSEIIAFVPIVTVKNNKLWSKYSVLHSSWIDESILTLRESGHLVLHSPGDITETIFREDNETLALVRENGVGPYAPLWQMSPPPKNASIINYNLLADDWVGRLIRNMEAGEHLSVSGTLNPGFLADYVIPVKSSEKTPRSLIFRPLFDSFELYDTATTTREPVGFLMAVVSWESYLTDLLPEGVEGITCVMTNDCGDTFTFDIAGHNATFIGWGDHHDRTFDAIRFSTSFDEFYATGDFCNYRIDIYPTSVLLEEYSTNKPAVMAIIMAIAFVVTGIVFSIFVHSVNRRYQIVKSTAVRANKIVTSLFPSNVRDRIMQEVEEKANKAEMRSRKSGFFAEAQKARLKTFLDEENDEYASSAEGGGEFVFETKPIADLFPDATVLFADIVGFTAWSSIREPSQVFQLLETIYHSFDQIAKRRRVFKVETIGDCYVAVTGLPDPRKDHALVMARFARDCMISMQDLTKKMEITLGPDTGDLSMRFGLHSGPVTAGVLRGEKSRFQLFGDTVNTAARMESNGARDRIHLSQETADLLIAGGKSKWVVPREGTIMAKGKGELKTYWLNVNLCDDHNSSELSGDSNHGEDPNAEMSTVQTPKWENDEIRANEMTKKLDPKMQRLIAWNCDQLVRNLKAIVARRNALKKTSDPDDILYEWDVKKGDTVLEEVKEIITLPNYDSKLGTAENPNAIELPPDAVSQLHDYVTNICMMYRSNPFHSFEHASHVTMSVTKLLARIVAPEDVTTDKDYYEDPNSSKTFVSALHDHTYGITSDPLTQFACTFSALIHDVDHSGVPNAQLIKESVALAERYKNQSVAEQNSVDLAWELLMDPYYKDLRSVIYADEVELKRFRELVVNSVMATDIVDKELKNLRNARWEKAFSGVKSLNLDEDRNRKATIVIEHVIQASDIAHTMQHWHVYRKWNERLFKEMYLAYKSGRATKDPSEFWYKGEIGFFDFYIIPLAKKLKDCGVFGVSSDEYLNYAQKNREEWERKGEEIVEDMLRAVIEGELHNRSHHSMRSIA